METKLDDLLRRAAARLRVAVERRLSDLDLTAAQFAVLAVIASAEGVSAAEVARTENLTAPTISVIIGNLERRGLVRRRPHPENARIQQLETTELGLKRFEAASACVDKVRRRIVGGAQGEDLQVVARWLAHAAELDI